MKDVQLWSRKVGNSKVQECAEVLKYGQGCFRRVKDGKGLPNISKKALFWEVLNGEGRSRMFKIVQRYSRKQMMFMNVTRWLSMVNDDQG